MMNTNTTYLKVQVGGILWSECSSVLVDILLYVGDLWCEKPIFDLVSYCGLNDLSSRSKYLFHCNFLCLQMEKLLIIHI